MDQYSARARPASRAPALIPAAHPAAAMPRRRLASLRPGMVVDGVVTRLVRGGALVDILLESNEPAFLPLRSIPAKAMPVIRELVGTGAMHAFRIDQLDRAQGTATLSVEGLVQVAEDQEANVAPPPVARREAPAPAPSRPPAPPAKSKPSAGELARERQRELLRRMREGGGA